MFCKKIWEKGVQYRYGEKNKQKDGKDLETREANVFEIELMKIDEEVV